MESFLDILKYILPAALVGLAVYYVLKMFFDAEEKKRMMEYRINQQKATTPLRLQAYERLALLLERITPSNLIMRVHKPGMSARLLQTDLLKAIRNEFDHNVAQQIYVSPVTWEAIKGAKEETIKIINLASSRVKDDSNGVEMTKAIFDIVAQLPKQPTMAALEALKKEARQLF